LLTVKVRVTGCPAETVSDAGFALASLGATEIAAISATVAKTVLERVEYA
jgi:hypothetical protein